MPQQVNLKSWLNARLFERVDLHEIFKAFYGLEVDLDYVLFLGAVFYWGDAVRRHRKFDRRRGFLPLSLPSVSNRAKKLEGLRLSEALPALDVLNDPVEVEKLLELKGKAEMLLGEINHELDAISARCDSSPLFSLLVQFGFPREFFNARGDPGDRWGNFFLLAITEYLRAQTGKPKYRLAYRLFGGLRKDAKHIHDPKHDVAGRIAQLKKVCPNWQTSLEILESEYHKQTRHRSKVK